MQLSAQRSAAISPTTDAVRSIAVNMAMLPELFLRTQIKLTGTLFFVAT
jgi:hypothetical protein